MDFLDFFIGLSLIHAMPHLILGVWNRKMYTPFGRGRVPNVVYSLLVLSFSLTLFIIKYGVGGLMNHGIYLGSVLGLVLYFLIGPMLYKKIRASRQY